MHNYLTLAALHVAAPLAAQTPPPTNHDSMAGTNHNATADVGIAIGTGTDVAIESAGVTLVKGDLIGIVRARRLSHATMPNNRQNLFLAFIYSAIGVPVVGNALRLSAVPL